MYIGENNQNSLSKIDPSFKNVKNGKANNNKKKSIHCSTLMSYNIIQFRLNKVVDLIRESENFRYVACRRISMLSLALKQRINTFRTKQSKDNAPFKPLR